MVIRILSTLRKNKTEKLNYKEDLLSKLGREQLKQMVERGTDLPIALL